MLDNAVPGLIDDGSGDGAVSTDLLLNSTALGLTGLIAAGVLLFTAFGWLGAGREAVRHIFRLPGQDRNMFLLWLKDLGLTVAFGAAVLVSAVISVISTTALGIFYDWIGLDERSSTAYWIGRVVGVLLVFVLDAVILGVFYRVVSGIPIPFRLLAPGTLLAAGALGVLKVLGQVLLGGGTNNPLLASFAVIIGLLIWFNLVCQVILVGAAWIAVGASDRGLTLLGNKKKAPQKVSAAG